MPPEGHTENTPKLRQNCPYGFSCAAMMLLPGIIAHDCENLSECVKLAKAEGVPWNVVEQPTFDLVVYRQEREIERERRRIAWEAGREIRQRRQQQWDAEYRRIREVITMRQHEAAVMMLKQRGNCQQYADYAIAEPLNEIIEAAEHLQGLLPNLEAYDRGYIAPDGVEACIYSVKRPPNNAFPNSWTLQQIRQEQSIYHYHKLKSVTAQFQSVLADENGNLKRCKVIHLSHADNARNIQGRLGIERRNRLSQIQTRLLRASQDLIEAIALAEVEFEYEDILAQSLEAANDNEQPDMIPQPSLERDTDRNSQSDE